MQQDKSLGKACHSLLCYAEKKNETKINYKRRSLANKFSPEVETKITKGERSEHLRKKGRRPLKREFRSAEPAMQEAAQHCVV